eukprot:7155242-Pyramimonas_sp.AAC.1
MQGFAVLARAHIGLRGPGQAAIVVHPHRALHAVVHFPGWPPLHLIVMYLADWDAAPRQVEEAGFPREAQLTIVAPPRPTCISPTTSRAIDFFAVNAAARHLVDYVM